MAYLDQGGYEARFGAEELAQVLATDATLTLAQAIADAESIVNSYLAAVPLRSFVVPLVVDPIPSRIAEITADLARYEIHAKAATDEMKERRKQAIAFLEAVVAGKAVIVELLPDAGAIVVGGGADYIAEERVFTRDSLAGY